MESERKLLGDGAESLGISLTEAQLDALLRLVDELERANAQMNLTAIRDRPGMIQKHLLDSFTLQPFLRGHRIADVGTGAGFPGLPLAVINPERHFTLIDSVGKKARFVEQTAQRIGCANVEMINQRSELYRPPVLFDTVMARALASIADFIAYAGRLCAPSGTLLAMKGRSPDAELAVIPRSFRLRAVHRVALPGLLDQRHIVELVPAPQ